MKQFAILVCAAWCTIASALCDSTPFSTNVNNLWLNGDKAGVLAIANQRIQQNPNDIGGLVLALQYKITFFDVTNLADSIDKVIAAGDSIRSPHFVAVYADLKRSLLYIRQNVPAYSPQQIQSEAAKGNIRGKPMDFLNVIQAAELDGLIP